MALTDFIPSEFNKLLKRSMPIADQMITNSSLASQTLDNINFGGASLFGSSSTSYYSIVVGPKDGYLNYAFLATATGNNNWICIDWGDGKYGVSGSTIERNGLCRFTSGSAISHTYSSVGTYTIKIATGASHLQFGNTNGFLVSGSNFNWDYIPNLTDGSYMFIDCNYIQGTCPTMPPNVTNLGYAFVNCNYLTITITKLPTTLTNAEYAFYGCAYMTSNISTLATNKPSGGYRITNAHGIFQGASNVTGSQSSFKSACPSCSNWTDAFTGTNTTT